MGGPGSGGFKNSPGDTETHSAWDIIAQDPDSGQVRYSKTTMPMPGERPVQIRLID